MMLRLSPVCTLVMCNSYGLPSCGIASAVSPSGPSFGITPGTTSSPCITTGAVFRCIELFSPAWILVFIVLAHDEPLKPTRTTATDAATTTPFLDNIRINTPQSLELHECKSPMRFTNRHSLLPVYPSQTAITQGWNVTLVSYLGLPQQL